MLELPRVAYDGHVAGWLGVGGTHAGPGGTREWLQIGYVGFDDGSDQIYYEVTLPRQADAYHTVRATVGPGEKHMIAVLESAVAPGSWRVWLDGAPVSPLIKLIGSHGRFLPEMIGETWNASRTACNVYDYNFSDVRVAAAPGGVWTYGVAGQIYRDLHNRAIKLSPDSFRLRSVAAAGAAVPAPPPILGSLASRLAGRRLTVRCRSQALAARELPAGSLLLSRAVCAILDGYEVAQPNGARAREPAGLVVARTAFAFLRGVARAAHVAPERVDCNAIERFYRAMRRLGATPDEALALRATLLRSRATIQPRLELTPGCPIQ
jgi:hypothetical protein